MLNIDLPQSLLVAIEVVSFCIIALLGIAVAIRAASLYARYKAAKKVTVDVDDSKVLKVAQEEGTAIILCSNIVGVADDAVAPVAAQEPTEGQAVAPVVTPGTAPVIAPNTEEDN